MMDRLKYPANALFLSVCVATALEVAFTSGCLLLSSGADSETKLSMVQRDALKEELTAMLASDQEYRRRGTDMSLSSEERQRVLAEGLRIDWSNTARLKQIVDEHGWPSRRIVGEAGAHAAFILLQHADHDPSFQSQCLPLLKRAAARGEISRTHVAYLTNRVNVKLNLP